MGDTTRKVFLPVIIIIVGGIVTFLLLVAYPDAKQLPPKVYKPVVRYQVAAKEDVPVYVNSQGTVTPGTESTLASRVTGQIIDVSPRFSSGGFFEKGEIMLKIDQADYQLAKTTAELQVAQAELRLAREEEEAELAREEWQKMGGNEATDLVLRKPQLNEARSSLAAAKAALNLANLNLNRTEVKAPYACIIRRKMADIGQLINVNTPVASIYATDYVEVRLPLPDADLAFLDMPYQNRNVTNNNKPAVRFMASFAGKTHIWEGILERVEGEIDQRNRMINVVGRVEDPYHRFKNKNNPPLVVGMFVSAIIEGITLKDVYGIDRSALRGENTIWIIDEQDKLYIRDIKIARLEKEKIFVESGIKDGEKICLTALDAVIDGMDVILAN